MRPEVATFFGIHDHDGDLAGGGRDAVDEEVAFYGRTIAELSAVDPGELTADRALDRDLAIHQARLGHFWLTEYRPWAGSSEAAGHIGEALFPLFTRDFAPLPERLEQHRLPARARHRATSPRRASASIDPVRLWVEIDLESTRQLPGFLDIIVAAAASEGAGDALVGQLKAASTRQRRLSRSTPPGSPTTCCRAPTPIGGRSRALRGDAQAPRARGRWRRDPGGWRGAARGREGGARRPLLRDRADAHRRRRSLDAVKDDHASTFAESLAEYRASMDRARAFVVEHGIATLPEEDHLDVIETPAFIRHLMPFAAYYEPGQVRPGAGRDVHRHPARLAGDDARAQPRRDQQHPRARGVPGPPPSAVRRHHEPEPGAPVLRRARVQPRAGPSTASG